MPKITLKICGTDGKPKLSIKKDIISLVYEKFYEPGDFITLSCDNKNTHLMIQLDDAIGESLIFYKEGTLSFEIPFGEKKACYSPKSFSGNCHLLTVREAYPEEICAYRNLALNKYDVHDNTSCFPHATANVETRGESVFAAKNAINGNIENHSHGIWPYESWGINRDPTASLSISFGRTIDIKKLALTIRADFPHDSWWTSVKLLFSDNTSYIWELEKTDQRQWLFIPKKEIEWIQLCNLIKADDSSPFPALSQLEVFGTEIR